jgi:anti-sigma B factor antagonist
VKAGHLPVAWHGQLAVISMPEEIDMSNGAEIQDGLLAALGKRPEVLVVDMTPTTFCDSAGVRAIMLTHRQAAAAGCELRLVIASPGVSRVFSIIGAGQLVQIHSELPSALDAVPGSPHDGSGPSRDSSGPSSAG